MTDEAVPTWDEGIERLLAKLPGLVGLDAPRLTINDARVIQYLAGERARIAELENRLLMLGHPAEGTVPE